MAREKHNSASILLMSAAFAAGFGLLLFSSGNQPRGPIERLGKQFEARLIVAPRWISGENVSRGASKAPGSLQGRPYLLDDGQPVIEPLPGRLWTRRVLPSPDILLHRAWTATSPYAAGRTAAKRPARTLDREMTGGPMRGELRPVAEHAKYVFPPIDKLALEAT